MLAEVEDGVANKLAGSVVGALATAIDFDNGMRELLGDPEAGLVAGATNGVNGLVLEEEESGLGVVVQHLLDVVLLEREGFLPSEAVEVLGGEDAMHR